MHVTLRSYLLGFGLSLLLTLSAYYAVVAGGALGRPLAVALVVGAALLQLWVQLTFFLHLTPKGADGRTNFLSFAFMGIILVVIVAGSLWIMDNSNSLMMAPVMQEMEAVGSPGAHSGHHGH